MDINDLLAPVSNSIWHSIPSNNFPIIYPCSDIGNISSALILLALVISILPKYVIQIGILIKSGSTYNFWFPSYMSK